VVTARQQHGKHVVDTGTILDDVVFCLSCQGRITRTSSSIQSHGLQVTSGSLWLSVRDLRC
jgi:hypothetical protein